ncbi:hypothetical protein N658DRAFT_41529 [Parathielavia hyrcaniae]|uniref:Uncharacterized protein n=1 Tax=Parathielavia hyrcaniae TaxID=113614 RepID=A0AAN6T2R7_9PEZI|nr:hypothetical protein N658DRAFT_41529 [Parathielavia hyrcaniae]
MRTEYFVWTILVPGTGAGFGVRTIPYCGSISGTRRRRRMARRELFRPRARTPVTARHCRVGMTLIRASRAKTTRQRLGPTEVEPRDSPSCRNISLRQVQCPIFSNCCIPNVACCSMTGESLGVPDEWATA